MKKWLEEILRDLMQDNLNEEDKLDDEDEMWKTFAFYCLI